MEVYTVKTGITNNYLLCSKKGRCILIDAGVSGKCKELIKRIDLILGKERTLELIVITHAHYDHFGSLKCIKEYFGCSVLSSEFESKIIEKGEFVSVNSFNLWGKFLIFVSQFMHNYELNGCNVDKKIRDTYLLDEYGFNGKIVLTPGHTEGSLSVVMEDGNCFIGDLLMNGFPLTSKPSLSIFGYSKDEIKSSLERLIECGCKNFYPSHGSVIGVNKVRRLVYGD